MGLVAGWGSFPVEIARRCIQNGTELHVIGLEGHADPQLAELADRFQWMGVAKLGGHIRFFRKAGIHEVAFAGKLFKHRLLYQGWGWLKLLPDWTCVRTLASIFLTRAKNGCDDTILGTIANAFQKSGMRIMSIHEAAPSLLVSQGVIVGRKPNHSQMADIRFGWDVARQMVLGVEAIEGTDGLIERTGQLCPCGGFTLIKLAKPKQDMRFDVPAIGAGTVQQMSVAGGKLIAVEANRTILLDRELTIETARQLGVTIVAFSEAELQSKSSRGEAAA